MIKSIGSIPQGHLKKMRWILYLTAVLYVIWFRSEMLNIASDFREHVLEHEKTKSMLLTHPCSKYHGLLHISSGDRDASSATLFYQYVLNQLIYAEQHNLLPYIHLDDVSYNVYDPAIHEVKPDDHITSFMSSAVWKVTTLKNGSPGPPECCSEGQTNVTLITLPKTDGIWNHYFSPTNEQMDFDPTHPTCQALPYIKLSESDLVPSMRNNAPWAVHSWAYNDLSPFIKPIPNAQEDPLPSHLHQWYTPQRKKASEIVKKYFNAHPNIQEQALQLVPQNTQCLSVHIRHSDKADGRERIPVSTFFPYLRAYLEEIPFGKIYLATDSPIVIEDIAQHWTQISPTKPIQDILMYQSDILRSGTTEAVFASSNWFRHHEVNSQVLVDIHAMSRCQYFVHGFSAVSEAVHYMAYPSLNSQSVDLEDIVHESPESFKTLVSQTKRGIIYSMKMK